MIETICDYCKKPIKRKLSRFLKSKRHYCNISCYNKDKPNWFVPYNKGKKRPMDKKWKQKSIENLKKGIKKQIN